MFKCLFQDLSIIIQIGSYLTDTQIHSKTVCKFFETRCSYLLRRIVWFYSRWSKQRASGVRGHGSWTEEGYYYFYHLKYSLNTPEVLIFVLKSYSNICISNICLTIACSGLVRIMRVRDSRWTAIHILMNTATLLRMAARIDLLRQPPLYVCLVHIRIAPGLQFVPQNLICA